MGSLVVNKGEKMIYSKDILVVGKSFISRDRQHNLDDNVVGDVGFPVFVRAYYVVIYSNTTIKVVKNRFSNKMYDIPPKVWEEIHRLIALDASLNN
jgi:hypothetical protein